MPGSLCWCRHCRPWCAPCARNKTEGKDISGSKQPHARFAQWARAVRFAALPDFDSGRV